MLAESLDRFSRDQEDTAGLFKRLTFAGVNIVTIADGDITHVHIGFKGTPVGVVDASTIPRTCVWKRASHVDPALLLLGDYPDFVCDLGGDPTTAVAASA